MILFVIGYKIMNIYEFVSWLISVVIIGAILYVLSDMEPWCYYIPYSMKKFYTVHKKH